MISIIIPSHNEESVIGETLKLLVPGVSKNLFEVIVVCNGCSDNTVKVVRSFGGGIQCVETPVASKTHALNVGDSSARYFPRIYLDADVRLGVNEVIEIEMSFKNRNVLAVSPRMKMDLENASLLVKAYYLIWQQLPYVKRGMIGTGVYALSQEGRERFGKFPEIIADDGYVRALFGEHERNSLDHCCSLVRAPATLTDLIKIKTRSRMGRYELCQKFNEIFRNENKDYGNAIAELLCRVYLWPAIAVYIYVNLISRLRAKKQMLKSGFVGWERDDSSRIGLKGKID